GSVAKASAIRDSGYPTLYGRFKGSSRPAALTPPGNTVAFNPYSRPQAPARPGETPRGAQLLSTMRQSPGGGRDLYASPDGNVYLRKNDGWYQRQAGGNWSKFAPLQGGQIERGQVANARGAQSAAGGGAYRIAGAPTAAAARNQARADRVPNVGA